MKKLFLILIILFAVFPAISHSQVYEEEFRELPSVVFINFEGPHFRIDTAEQIRQLGVVLGQQVANATRQLAPTLETMTIEERMNHSRLFEFGGLNRYFVIHSISPPENGRLDADILGLGVDTAVDHIRNLRRIVKGYLQAAYNYSEADAALLAEFITIYNAVYRGNWDFFTSRFKTPVVNHLIRERAGLSIRFDEWPGRTMMLIPLGHGGLSAIDTAAIAGRRVIEELRREDDMGVPQRQDLVDLMERQAEEAEQQAQAEREIIRQEEAAITQERRQVEEERRQAEQERAQIEEERERIAQAQEAEQITQQEAEAARAELERREEAAAQQEQAVQEREQELERREEIVRQRRRLAEWLEEFAEKRFDEAQHHREEIALDQQAVIAQQVEGGVLAVNIERDSPVAMGRITRVDLDGREIRSSALNNVHIRTVTFLGGRILAIAGAPPTAVRIVEINPSSLEMARQGDTNIRIGSLLWVNGGDLYAIIDDGSAYIGRFDTNLVLQAQSEVQVHPSASVIIQQGRLLTQRSDGSVLILNPANLTEMIE